MADWYFAPLKPCHYTVILADPPTYHASYSAFDGAKAPPYPTMSDAWLRDLPVGHLAAADCLLCLWSTMPKLKFSLDLLEVWGFRYVTAGAWFKRTVNGKIAYGTGKVLMSGAEPFLLGARGRPAYAKRPVKGVFESDAEFDAALADQWQTDLNAMRREHSRKPDDQYERLETLMGDVPRCELFSQTSWPGWDVWGAETGKYDVSRED